MTIADIILICGLSAFAAALGWFAARLTMEKPSEQDSRSPKALAAVPKSFGKSRSSGAPKGKQKYIAVINIGPSQDASLSAEHAEDHELQSLAKHLTDAPVDLLISRLNEGTIECEFFADCENAAIDLTRGAVEALKKHAAASNLDGTKQPRVAIGRAPCDPPTQAAFDSLREALTDTALAAEEVVCVDTEGRTNQQNATLEVMRGLRDALRANEISLAYQPKLNVKNGRFESAEALFRWESEKRNQLSIGELIVLAEQSGMIRELTLWSFKQAVLDQLELIERGINITTFVNLSADLISDSEFALQVIETLKNTSGRIGVEITETSVIREAGHALANLELFSAAGIMISIDDYGTGLSSLRYLKRIPAQELKIDREFIKDLTTSHRDPMIVRSTIDLAHALGLTVTAEGVDDPTKMALLKVMGCDQLQGYHIAKPMSLDTMFGFIAQSEADESLSDSESSVLSKLSIAKP